MITAVDALDRLHELAACYRAVEALTIPDADAHSLNRDDLAMLLSVLNRCQRDALMALTQAVEAH